MSTSTTTQNRPQQSRGLATLMSRAAAMLLLTSAVAGAQAGGTPAVDKSAKVGAGLYEIVSSPQALFVASVGNTAAPGAKIFILDPVTLAQKNVIELPDAAAFGLGINTKTHKVYTSNTRAGSVTVIDAMTGKIAATIKLDSDPTAHLFRVLVDEARNSVYVSVADNPGKVWVIDGATDKIATVIDSVGTRTTGLTLDPAANRLYAASQGTNEIIAIDLATHKVVQRFPSGGVRTTQLAFDSKTNRIFATNQTSGDLTVIDSKTGALIKAVKTGAGALGVGFNPNTNLVYVANRQAGTVTVINATSFEVVADLKAGALPNTIAIDPATNVVYVTNKARAAARGAEAPVVDDGGDTVTRIRPR